MIDQPAANCINRATNQSTSKPFKPTNQSIDQTIQPTSVTNQLNRCVCLLVSVKPGLKDDSEAGAEAGAGEVRCFALALRHGGVYCSQAKTLAAYCAINREVYNTVNREVLIVYCIYPQSMETRIAPSVATYCSRLLTPRVRPRLGPCVETRSRLLLSRLRPRRAYCTINEEVYLTHHFDCTHLYVFI